MAADVFYNDLPEAERKIHLAGLVYQSKASKEAQAHFVAADVTISKTYIVCTKDRAAPVDGQRAWAEITGCNIREIETDHSPFLTDSGNKQVLDVIVDIASK